MTGWLADSLLAALSFPWLGGSCFGKAGSAGSSEHELRSRSPNQDGRYSIALKFQNESEFVAAGFLLFP